MLNSLHNSNLHNIRNAFAKQQLTYPVTVHYKAFSVKNDLLLYPNSLHNSVHNSSHSSAITAVVQPVRMLRSAAFQMMRRKNGMTARGRYT